MTPQELLLQQKIPLSFRSQALKTIQEIAIFLKINYVWLLLVMLKESRLNPLAVNSASKAKGLIQFMPSTLAPLEKKLGKTLPQNFIGQLEFVKEYFRQFAGKLNSYEDVYFAVFYPAAIGKSNDTILGITRGSAYAKLLGKQNKALDGDKDGMVTVGEAKTWFRVSVSDYLSAAVSSPPVILLLILGIGAAFFLP
jgi:hypothetical protein